MKRDKISRNVILRLPRYLRYLEDLRKNDVDRISSGELGQLMGITASQIRQDLSCFGEFGQQGYGYNIEHLKEELGEILGITRPQNAIIIGAGNLGRALIGNFPFERNGFRLTGAFDVSKVVVGAVISGLEVYHMDDLERYLPKTAPDIAILTMPGGVANATADRLINVGISGIWNFTNVDLKITDPNITIESVHFSDSLLTLGYYLSANTETQEK